MEDPLTYGTNSRAFCGLDLHENEKPVFNESGVYSAQLFTQTAIDVVKNHDKTKVHVDQGSVYLKSEVERKV